MNAKQEIIKSGLGLLKTTLGNERALTTAKTLIRRLPHAYAFPLTWVCLEEFSVESVSERHWLYGSPRQFSDVKVKVNPKCLSSRFFSISGYFEEALTQEILSKQREGLLVDIGANYGYYSVLWLQNPKNRAIAVEPVTEYVNLLQENLSPYPNRHHIFAGCMGDYDGVALLDTCGDPTMLSRVVSSDTQANTRQVPMLTLNSLLAKYNEERISVLKIDAEGYDIKILETCKPLFEAKRIQTVFWETAATSEFSVHAEGERAIAQFLESLGYTKILSGSVTGYELR
ncbi:FkbM family methyltransferase [Kamptonema cortianum]|uniref:FkbM family methyltransferase n=1 Tax=Geitlerinema calcuttense NRMC-F 0142 TaxID=2922238 RepID=A0ABT7LY94_9CYAN|nr:FkbM family methyltransferase [Geitlerinema calcuttense]MDK3157453.1 FkbM family methyltransferase [Kamptonema cortianum]MDL5056981.1 FkbM family methyltransferase [Geitlerinema calcuttense NRMC-F 0142]